MEQRGFEPTDLLQGPIQVPGSKSIAQRALAAAAFAHGTTELVGLPSSDDVVHALRCARAAGATFPSEERPDDLFVTALLRRRGHGRLAGAPPLEGEGARPWCAVTVGESGTTARLFTALLALGRPAGSGAEVLPSGSLTRRRSAPLFRALVGAGAAVEHAAESDAGWPVLLTAATPPEKVALVQPASSQEVSALLLALATRVRRRTLEVEGLTPSAPYVELTLDLLRRFGARVEHERMPWGARYSVVGPLRAPAEPLEIEPDASSAAVALAAGCISGGEVAVEGLGASSLQPDLACLDLLRRFGCRASADAERLIAGGRPDTAAEVDLGESPDLAPVAAALAAAAVLQGAGSSHLTGLHTLPGKESSRIEVLARGLAAAGFTAEAGPDSLTIGPGAGGTREVLLDPAGDHRMAFAFALLGLARPGVRVQDAGCVSKSWPGFWSDLARAR